MVPTISNICSDLGKGRKNKNWQKFKIIKYEQ